VAGIAALGDGGFERLDGVEAAAEILADGADVQSAIGGAHVLSGEVGVEDFGDFVPGGFVGAGDVVEVVALDEEVVEDGVEVGVHGGFRKGQRGRGKERGVEVSKGGGGEKVGGSIEGARGAVGSK
jgi:hypothetical protein